MPAESRMILATDIDKALTGPGADARKELFDSLNRHDSATLVYITSRPLDSARAMQELTGLPRPDVFITDEGATVEPARTELDLSSIEKPMDERWPGHDSVRERVRGISGIEEGPFRASRRITYYLAATADPATVTDSVRDALEGLPVTVRESDGAIDILPAGVDKGETLRRVSQEMNVDPARVFVAAGSSTDVHMFDKGFRTVVVGNAPEDLRRSAADRVDVYLADSAGAEGVVEGLSHFGMS